MCAFLTSWATNSRCVPRLHACSVYVCSPLSVCDVYAMVRAVCSCPGCVRVCVVLCAIVVCFVVLAYAPAEAAMGVQGGFPPVGGAGGSAPGQGPRDGVPCSTSKRIRRIKLTELITCSFTTMPPPTAHLSTILTTSACTYSSGEALSAREVRLPCAAATVDHLPAQYTLRS